MSGALGTYAAALIVIAASTAIGAGILAACGRREWSWTAPAVGLAAATIVAWWAVRLPGHGWTALAALAALSIIGGALAVSRLEGLAAAAAHGAPVLAATLAAGAIPFLAEGHFGVLGTGFNVDMSQHLYAASWLADPSGPGPGLYEQGYPLGPHALAVATGEIAGQLTLAFSGVTIAAVVIAGLTALAGTDRWPAWRAGVAATLTAIAYLAASYFAQGAFKELFEIALLIGFALWLAELRREGAPADGSRPGIALAAPGAVIAAGALYAYSSPGLAWIGGTLLAWAAIELLGDRRRAGARVRAAAPAVAMGALLVIALAAPEIDRIADFGGSVGTVSDSSREDSSRATPKAPSERDRGVPDRLGKLDFDDDLGNLFGQISPLEAFGVWPSGDFRVAPGDGAVPAIAFYLGALLGAVALALGVAAALRAGETALLAALAAALAIWLGARIASTPYTAAKALAVLGSVIMLISARGLLRPPAADSAALPRRPGPIGVAVAAAFLLAAAASSALALGNAPVGPREYHPGARELTAVFAGRPTLVLVPDEQLNDEHGADFYGWEFREAAPPCVISSSAANPGMPAPPAWLRIAVVDGPGSAPFDDVEKAGEADGVSIWKVGKDETGGEEPACPPAGVNPKG